VLYGVFLSGALWYNWRVVSRFSGVRPSFTGMASIFRRIQRRVRRFLGVRQVRACGVWFVDVPRTSSTSIRVELGRALGAAYQKHNVLEAGYDGKRVFDAHIPACEMRQILGRETWENIFTFAMVRNPWDRTFSMYNFRRKRRPKSVAGVEFSEYIRRLASPDRCSDGMFDSPAYYRGAVDYVVDRAGEVIVDYIGRYEAREEAMKVVGERLGLAGFGELFLQRASPVDRHYSEFYDDETRELIAQVYARDIELFGYSFECA
jgi:hypothetical protein